MLMDPHPSHKHACLHRAVWQLQQEVTSPKARFKPALPEKSGVDVGTYQVPTYLGQSLHLYFPWWSCLVIIIRILCLQKFYHGDQMGLFSSQHVSQPACCCRTVELVFVIVKVLEVDPNDLHFTLSQLRPLSKVQQKLTLKWHHNVMLKNYIFIGQRKLNNI